MSTGRKCQPTLDRKQEKRCYGPEKEHLDQSGDFA